MTGLEAIVGRPEGGWIATGKCGRPHLVGRGWSWFACRTCAVLAETVRSRSTDRINAAQARTLAHYYPPEGSP